MRVNGGRDDREAHSRAVMLKRRRGGREPGLAGNRWYCRYSLSSLLIPVFWPFRLPAELNPHDTTGR